MCREECGWCETQGFGSRAEQSDEKESEQTIRPESGRAIVGRECAP